LYFCTSKASKLSKVRVVALNLLEKLGTQFTCFTGTKVQILTQKKALARVAALNLSVVQHVQPTAQGLQVFHEGKAQRLGAEVEIGARLHEH